MSQIDQLLRLQQVDNQIRERKQRLVAVLRAQKQDEDVRAARARDEKAEAALSETRAQQKDLELELGQLNDEAQRAERRLYSGNVSNPKELSDLEQKLASLRRRRSALEDELLEAMLLVEDAQEERDEAAAALEETEAAWAAQSQTLQAEQNELAVAVNDLLAKREAQVSRIEPSFLRAYEATAERRGGVAVAAVKGGLCQVCGVRASSQKVRAAAAGEIAYCGSCDRILAP